MAININRDNYEEFFLLYIDKELSAAERSQVELFLQTNRDLQPEMEILKSTIFSSDDISFPDKQQLLKEEIAAEVQSLMLMHIDNELDVSEKILLEKQIASDSLLQKEFALLQQTKLDDAQKIIFTDKASLYRKETSRVVGMYFRRLAAAAVLLGILCTAGYFILNSKHEDNPSVVVAEKPTSLPDSNKKADVKNVVISDPVLVSDKNDDNQPNNPVTSTDHKVFISANNHLSQKNISSDKSNMPDQKNISNPRNNQDQNIVQQEKKSDQENKLPLINEEVNNKQTANNVVAPLKKPEVPLTDADLTKTTNNDALMASLNDDESNKILYIEEEKITRSRIGSFVKKVKRVVERNAKIKTGNLRIGGFEVALK